MKHRNPLVIALTAAGLMAMASTGFAQTASPASKRPPASTARKAAPPAPTPAATPSGDTHVHRFFQAWGRGMDHAGEALDKVPKPDSRWPGKANTQRPPDTSPGGDPYSSP